MIPFLSFVSVKNEFIENIGRETEKAMEKLKKEGDKYARIQQSVYPLGGLITGGLRAFLKNVPLHFLSTSRSQMSTPPTTRCPPTKKVPVMGLYGP